MSSCGKFMNEHIVWNSYKLFRIQYDCTLFAFFFAKHDSLRLRTKLVQCCQLVKHKSLKYLEYSFGQFFKVNVIKYFGYRASHCFAPLMYYEINSNLF